MLLRKVFERRVACLALALANLASVSCQTTPSPKGAADPGEAIIATLTRWDNGFRNENRDEVIGALSNDFRMIDPVYMDWTLFTGVLDQLLPQMRFTWTEAELWIEGDTAIVAPVMMGAMPLGFALVETEEGWRISRMFAESH